MPRQRLCKCCKRRRRLNQRRLCGDCEICLHCGSGIALCELGLCECCGSQECIRDLYRRGYSWSPEWEMHLRRKTAEVQRMLRRLEPDGECRKKKSS